MSAGSALPRLKRLVVFAAFAVAASTADARFLSGFDAFRAGEYCKARDYWLKSERDGDSNSAFGPLSFTPADFASSRTIASRLVGI